MVDFKPCPDFPDFECDCHGFVRRIDRKPYAMILLPSTSNPERKYYSITCHWSGHVHKQIFKAWGPPNPNRLRYSCIDHIDNDPTFNDV